MVSGFDVTVTVVDTNDDFVLKSFHNKKPPENSETALKSGGSFLIIDDSRAQKSTRFSAGANRSLCRFRCAFDKPHRFS